MKKDKINKDKYDIIKSKSPSEKQITSENDKDIKQDFLFTDIELEND